MKEFNSVKGIQLRLGNDEIDFFSLLKNNFTTGKELTKLLSKKLDGIEISYIGEIFTEFDKTKYNGNFENLKKFFTLREGKIGSRGIGYYGLFGDVYDVESRNSYVKYPKQSMSNFWDEYDEYIKTLGELKNNENMELLYLDNFRNLILLWSYILVTIEKSDKNNYNFLPIQNLSFRITNINVIKQLLNELVSTYSIILENIINIALGKGKVKDLLGINLLYEKVKAFFCNEKIFLTKKGKFTLNDFFSANGNNSKIWFEKIFRNNREEDNLGVMLSFLLQKRIKLSDKNSRKKILSLINTEKLDKKNEIILSAMYGGIEFALLAKYLGYEAGWINYSVYHFGEKDTYRDLKDVYYSLTNTELRGKEVIILDDNIASGDTLVKIQNILQNNQIAVKMMAVPRIYLSKDERKKLKKNININKITSIYSNLISISKEGNIIIRLSSNKRLQIAKDGQIKILSRVGKYNIHPKDISEIYNILTSILGENKEKIQEVRKHIALNSLYLFPRVERKGRNINILIARKVQEFRRKFRKEFRSL